MACHPCKRLCLSTSTHLMPAMSLILSAMLPHWQLQAGGSIGGLGGSKTKCKDEIAKPRPEGAVGRLESTLLATGFKLGG